MCNKTDPSASVQLDTSLTIKQLIDIRAGAIRILEATNKAIALNQFSGNTQIDNLGLITQAQNEEFINVHNAVDAILDSLGVPLVGDDMPVLVAEKLSDSDVDACRKAWEKFCGNEKLTPIETTKNLKLNHSILHCQNIT